MPPEVVLVPAAWRAPLGGLALAWATLVAMAWNDWSEMAHQ